jgi:hypothetical protein
MCSHTLENYLHICGLTSVGESTRNWKEECWAKQKMHILNSLLAAYRILGCLSCSIFEENHIISYRTHCAGDSSSKLPYYQDVLTCQSASQREECPNAFLNST